MNLKRLKLNQEIVARLREVLNRKSPRHGQGDDHLVFLQGVFDSVRVDLESDLSRALPHLARAAKGSKTRQHRRRFVLLELGDTPHPVLADEADNEIRQLLESSDSDSRDRLFQNLSFHPTRIRFAPEIRKVVGDRNDPCWPWAVQACGCLRDEDAIELLLQHEAGLETPFCLLDTLRRLKLPACRPILVTNLQNEEPRTRTFSLWGLAALGHETPFAKLFELLDDPTVETEWSMTPGQSIRAAQALCDLLDWPFEWTAESVPPTKTRCLEHFGEDWLSSRLKAFEEGRLDMDEDPIIEKICQNGIDS